jgi:hypothetical protein
VWLRSNLISEPLPKRNFSFTLISLDLSFNRINSSLNSVTDSTLPIWIDRPVLAYASGLGKRRKIKLSERVVNLIGNSFATRYLYLTDNNNTYYPVSIYPQISDMCAPEMLSVSRDFPNEIWRPVLERVNASKTFSKMCGGTNCSNGVIQYINADFEFCQPSTKNCTYPCVSFQSSSPQSPDFVLSWYDSLSFFRCY